MEKLNQKNFALASGLASVVIYLGCFVLMAITGQEGIIKISNLLFHGVDFSNIIRMDIPIGETLLGGAISFCFWALVGYLVSLFYNLLK